MTTYTVGTQAELETALRKASGGDRIELAAGNYGDVRIWNASFSSDMTITSANPDDPAVFNTISLYEARNITLDNIEVDFEPTADTLDFDSAVRMSEVSDITISNSTLTGGNAVAGIPADSPPGMLGNKGIEGYPIGRAVTAHNAENIAFIDNEISDFKTGISMAHVDGLVVEGVDFQGLRTTAISGGHIDNADIVANTISNLTPWRSEGGGDHGDFVHFWTVNGQGRASENLTFTDNFFEQGDAGGSVLGIYIEDNGKGIGYTNILIENNVIHNGDSQGLTIENTEGLIIRDNTLLQSSGGPNDAPGILLLYGTSNVQVDNNVLAGIWGGAYEMADALNINVGSDNLFVQSTDPSLPNYVDDLFVNALTPNGDISDLMVLPDSAADGVGASLTQYDSGSGAILGIRQEASDGYDMKSITPSVVEFYDPANHVDLADAEIVWDFGDGNTKTGIDVTHTYQTLGAYVVTAQVTMPGNAPIVLNKNLIVETPYAIQADFERGFQDLSGFANDVSNRGNASLETTALGKSVSLDDDGSSVNFALSKDMQNNTEFSIAFDFRADQDVNPDGMIMYFSGSGYARLVNGNLQFNGSTTADEAFEIVSRGIDLDDGNWHQVVYSFSQGDGTATLYVDGQEIEQVINIEGSQRSSHGQGLNIGNPFGGSFTGNVDNIAFDRAAMTRREVAERYNDLLAELGQAEVPLPPVEAPEEEVSPPVARDDAAPADEVSDDFELVFEASAPEPQPAPAAEEILLVAEDVPSGELTLIPNVSPKDDLTQTFYLEDLSLDMVF